MPNIEECVICYEIMNTSPNITFANCKHGNCAHAKCIIRWNDTCPLCRSVIYDNNHTSDVIQDKIDYNLRH